MSAYSMTFMLPTGMVKFDETGACDVILQDQKVLTAAELAICATMSQMICRLKNGKLIDFDFQPKSYENQDQIVKCEWLRSGNLAWRGPADKQYDFADTLEEALQKKRTFTCKRSVYLSLPKTREWLPVDKRVNGVTYARK